MTFLSDMEIESARLQDNLVIEPWDRSCLQPASVDLHLSKYFKIMVPQETIDPRQPVKYEDLEANEFRMAPYGFVLASTIERIEIPDYMIGRLEGKSSLGRLGLTAHITAGFFDPGFKGYPTLELFNANPVCMMLFSGMKICQISFARLGTAARSPYGSSNLDSKYQGQDARPMGSQYHRNFHR